MTCPFKTKDADTLDTDALQHFTTVGDYLWKGINAKPDVKMGLWEDAMKANAPDALNTGDLLTIRQNMRATNERATGVPQTIHPHEAFTIALAQKFGSNKKAAAFVNDLVNATGDTKIIDKLATKGVDSLDPKETLAFNKAWAANKRGPVPKSAKPGGILETVNGLIDNYRKSQQSGDNRSPIDKLTDAFAGSLSAKGAKDWRVGVGEPILQKIVDGHDLTPTESQTLTSEFAKAQEAKPGSVTRPKPMGVDEVQSQMREYRKTVATDLRSNTTPKGLEAFVARTLHPEGAAKWRADVGDDILNKIGNNQRLSPLEFQRMQNAFQRALEGKPSPAINPPRAAVLEARKTITEAATEARKEIANQAAGKAFADVQSAKRFVRQQMAKQFKTAEAFSAFEDRLSKVADNPNAVKQFYQRELYLNKDISGRVGQRIHQAIQLSNTLRTTFDLSYVGRQGGILTAANPILAIRTTPDVLKAFFSDHNAQAIHDAILSRDNARLYKQGGLHLSEIATDDITKAEENYASTLATRILGLGKIIATSERGNVTFLNQIRANTFDSMAALTKKLNNGALSDTDVKAIGNYINVATGRGSLDVLPKAVQGVMQVMFSPKLVTSRFEYIAGSPLYARLERGSGGVKLKSAISSKGATAAVAAQYVKYYGAVLATLTIAKNIPGVKVETDLRSSNFGKLQIGDKTFDMMSGLAQAMVLVSRLATRGTKRQDGTVHALDGKGFDGTRGDVLGRFLRSKLRPDIGVGADALFEKNYIGQPYNPIGTPKDYYLDGALLQSIVPISVPDIATAARQDGMPQAAIVAMIDGMGISVNVLDKSAKKTGTTLAPDASLSKTDQNNLVQYHSLLSQADAIKPKTQEDLAQQYAIRRHAASMRNNELKGYFMERKGQANAKKAALPVK